MSNEMQFIIIVRFPEWEQVGSLYPEAGKEETVNKYPAFGVKYLLTMPVIAYPEWEEDDERWFTYSEEKIVAEEFKKAYANTIKGKDFDGEILFIEPVQLVPLKHPALQVKS